MSEDELSDNELDLEIDQAEEGEEELLYRDKGNWLYETWSPSELIEQTDEFLKHYISRKENRSTVIQEIEQQSGNNKELFMQILLDFTNILTEKGIKVAFEQLTDGKYGWEHPVFESIRSSEEKEINKRLKPITIEEGIYTCKKCGGKRTQSYEVQLRRADEPATVFVECVNPKCRNKWSMG